MGPISHCNMPQNYQIAQTEMDRVQSIDFHLWPQYKGGP